MFDKMKALMDMQKKMQELKRELDNTVFEVTSSDNLIKIAMSASQEVREVIIQADIRNTEKPHLERSIKDAYNRAIKRAQALLPRK